MVMRPLLLRPPAEVRPSVSVFSGRPFQSSLLSTNTNWRCDGVVGLNLPAGCATARRLRIRVHDGAEDEVKQVKAAPVTPRADMPFTPISHYAEHITPIGKIEWRKRAHVQGRVTSISTAPRGSAPTLQVEVWDETGGVTLNFLGRREIAGLEVGMEVRAEGMVGEEEGSLVILNPSYELVIQ